MARLGLISKVYIDMNKNEMKRKNLVYGILIVFGLIVIGTCSAIQEINPNGLKDVKRLEVREFR